MLSWLNVLLDVIKLLPVLIGLIKEIIEVIHGLQDGVKVAPAIRKAQLATLKLRIANAKNFKSEQSRDLLFKTLAGHMKRLEQ